MIPANELARVFRTIVGWPYASPGSNSSAGIDCSGAFVYAYRQFGERIYHGSNRIIRQYCRDVQSVSDAARLRVGMAVFMSRPDLSRMKAEYKPGGRFFDPALPFDYYHVGLVTSVSPLEIVNATPPRARIDTRLSRWCCAGYLKAVDYPDEVCPVCGQPTDGDADVVPPPFPFPAQVVASSGGTVNLRRQPDRSAVVRVRVPLGETVTVLAFASDDWWRVSYQKTTGYMMSEFLEPV